MTMKTITPEQLDQRMRGGEAIEVIDVRTPAEFREVHATIARNLPLDQLDCQQLMEQRHGKGHQPLYVICRSGNRSTKACEKLLAAGCPEVINIEGGTSAWEAAGLPVVRGKKAVSLERQVRILAGLMVIVGALLAIFVHPYFAAISAIVGAGLMHAGITDNCMAAMVLAKLPWNQAGGSNAQCQTS